MAALLANPALAQRTNLGTPPIRNFYKKNYRAGTQNWDIAQAGNGVLFFANNNGLLEFDGSHWRLFPLDNGTIVRSVQVVGDRVYVGGQGDFGFFSPDQQGKLAYQSLKPLLPDSLNFDDVWDILALADDVFFRSNNHVFRLHGGQVSALLPNLPTEFMGVLEGKLLVQDRSLLLHQYANGSFQPLGKPVALGGAVITGMLPYHGDTTLVSTIKNGIFYHANGVFAPWQTPHDAFFRENRIYCAARLPDGKLALGTSLNGLVVLDHQRRISQHLTKKGGLQNNTLLSLFADRAGSLWLGLDNGIDRVDINSPFSNIYPDGELEGTGYATQVAGGKIYFGTNTGLYALDWKPYYTQQEKQSFRLVPQTGGQAWSLGELDGELLMGHHEGAFSVRGLSARKLTSLPGIWRFVPLADGLAIAGHYDGLALFRKSASGWAFDSKLDGLSESSRILEKDPAGNLWMSHPYRGVYRLTVDAAARSVKPLFLNSQQGLPSDLNNYVFKLGGQLVFAGANGVFDFDETQQRFVPNTVFDDIFDKKTRVKYLRQDDSGHIWYVAGDETGVLLVKDGGVAKKVSRMPIPELSGKLVGGFEFVAPVDEHHVFFASERGFIHFDPTAYAAHDTSIQVVLHEVRLENEADSVLFGGHFPAGGAAAKPVLHYEQNALEFLFSATDYQGGEFVQFAHFLEGGEPGWSDWGSGNSLIFNNLRPGSYVFHLKAKSPHGVESGVLSYAFEIRPPWYASRAAYGMYGLVALGIVLGIFSAQRKHFERERRDLQNTHQQREEQHQLLARQSEEAINRLENEKLEAEVRHKNQELATATLHLVQKSDMLNTIQTALQRLEKQVLQTPELKQEISRIVRMLKHDASLDEDWEQFSKNFDHVHSDFLKRLAELFPQLSPNDYKLCAYLRMNLSTKEIASLMNISVRGVEASRYRLRRRLDLDAGTNLTEFMMKV